MLNSSSALSFLRSWISSSLFLRIPSSWLSSSSSTSIFFKSPLSLWYSTFDWSASAIASLNYWVYLLSWFSRLKYKIFSITSRFCFVVLGSWTTIGNSQPPTNWTYSSNRRCHPTTWGFISWGFRDHSLMLISPFGGYSSDLQSPMVSEWSTDSSGHPPLVVGLLLVGRIFVSTSRFPHLGYYF